MQMSLFNAHLCRRGLNPPHRIKSISMTTFSEQEIKLLKEGGNEVTLTLRDLSSFTLSISSCDLGVTAYDREGDNHEFS